MGQVTGRVTNTNRQSLPHVNVVIKNSDRGTQTDAQGNYTISGHRGDTLFFSHIGMLSEEVRVKRSSSVINVSLVETEVELEEVEVKAKYQSTHKTQKELLAEYPENKNLVKTTLGILDKDLSSSFFRIIDGNDLVPGGRDFLSSLKGHCPQMKVIRLPELKVYLRQFTGGNPSTVLFDVDGFVSLSPPTYLHATDIDRIAILERNAAISRYGQQGAAGVIVINTRARTEIDDRGLIRTYNNSELEKSLKKEVSYLEQHHPYEPSYIEILKDAGTRKEALAIYKNQKESYQNDPYYFLDVYDFFLSRWGNSEESKSLFQEARNHLADHMPELKALAYLQQRYVNHESALELYIQILMIQSWEGQAMRDVANAFAEAGDIKSAWMYYTQYIDIQNQLPDAHFDVYGGDQLITTEMMGILDVYEEPFLNNQDMENTLDDDMRTRLVFEWSHPEAEFELQFVTPEGFYDSWKHQPEKNASQDPVIAKGYSSKQFFLGKENIGLWQINMDYKGNGSELPSYLKVSVYRNFGLNNQQLEVKVYKLSEMHKKVQLFTLQQY